MNAPLVADPDEGGRIGVFAALHFGREWPIETDIALQSNARFFEGKVTSPKGSSSCRSATPSALRTWYLRSCCYYCLQGRAMKLLLVSTVTLAIVSGPALAADMDVKAPIAPPPAFSWTGLYLGGEGGGGWGRENYTDNSTALGFPPGALVFAPGTAVRQSPRGGIFGGVLGFRYQAGQFVFGVEGTAAWADLTSTSMTAFTPTGFGGTLAGTLAPTPVTDSFKVRSLYTATGQVGWAFDQALLYAKGGWAGGSVDMSFAIPATGEFVSQRQSDGGWTAGVGVDYAAWRNLVLGVEYDHFDLAYGAFSTVGILGNTYAVTNPSRLTIEQVVGRITYKFGLP
jgi:outer membrane immunogenic protein